MDPEAIVRGLAACDPVMIDRGHGPPICTLCRQGPEVEGDPVLHLDDCPWQLSRDWVDERDTPLN
jgi:hypothetical protein